MSKYDLVAIYGGVLRHAVVNGDMMTFEDGSQSDLHAYINMDAGTCFIAMLYWQKAKTDEMTWAQHFNNVMYALCDAPDTDTTAMVKAAGDSNQVVMLDGGAYRLYPVPPKSELWFKYDGGCIFTYDYVPVQQYSFIECVEYSESSYLRTVVFTDGSKLALNPDKTNFYKACARFAVHGADLGAHDSMADWFKRYMWQLQRSDAVIKKYNLTPTRQVEQPVIKERTAHIIAIGCGAFVVTLLVLAYLFNFHFGAN